MSGRKDVSDMPCVCYNYEDRKKDNRICAVLTCPVEKRTAECDKLKQENAELRETLNEIGQTAVLFDPRPAIKRIQKIFEEHAIQGKG
jgi:hypothetical protein